MQQTMIVFHFLFNFGFFWNQKLSICATVGLFMIDDLFLLNILKCTLQDLEVISS